jgi:hypothetical protein
VGILALATLAAGFGWYWNVQTTRRCLQFWGPEAALRIASAPKAELLQIIDQPGTGLVFPNQEEPFSVCRQVDISNARGFSNVRRLLVQDRSFDWTTRPALPSQDWKLAIRFDDGKANSLVLLAPEAGVVALDGNPGRAILDPAAAKILADFAAEQFAAASSAHGGAVPNGPAR